jgi:dolichol kinase
MAFSIWSAIFSTILYYKLYIFVLEKLPKCFTLGEAAVCTQSYTLLLYFTLVNVFQHVEKTPTTVMQMSTLTIQVGLFGISTIIFLTYLCDIRSPTKFYILTGSVFVFTVLLPLEILLKKNALLWILNLFWDDLQKSKVVLYWTVFSLVAIVSVNKRIKEAKKATTAVRKIFHVLTVAVFVPGLVYNCSFLYLASGVIFGIFFLLEVRCYKSKNIRMLTYKLSGFKDFKYSTSWTSFAKWTCHIWRRERHGDHCVDADVSSSRLCSASMDTSSTL